MFNLFSGTAPEHAVEPAMDLPLVELAGAPLEIPLAPALAQADEINASTGIAPQAKPKVCSAKTELAELRELLASSYGGAFSTHAAKWGIK